MELYKENYSQENPFWIVIFSTYILKNTHKRVNSVFKNSNKFPENALPWNCFTTQTGVIVTTTPWLVLRPQKVIFRVNLRRCVSYQHLFKRSFFLHGKCRKCVATTPKADIFTRFGPNGDLWAKIVP